MISVTLHAAIEKWVRVDTWHDPSNAAQSPALFGDKLHRLSRCDAPPRAPQAMLAQALSFSIIHWAVAPFLAGMSSAKATSAHIKASTATDMQIA